MISGGRFEEMDSFAELYAELSLLRLKYEHLSGVCKTLLKPWPNHDASGKRVPRDANTAGATAIGKQNGGQRKEEIKERQGLQHSDVPQEVPETAAEMHILEEILSRAQQIRISQQDNREKPSSARSNEMAARVYGNPLVKKTSSQRHTSVRMSHHHSLPSKRPGTQPTTKETITKSHAKQPTTPHAKQTTMSHGKQLTTPHAKQFSILAESCRSRDQSSPNLLHLQSSSHHLPTSSLERPLGEDSAKRRAQESQTTVQESHEEEGFNIEHNGSRLTMPSKYHKLLNTLSQINDHLQLSRSQNRHLTADHFCNRLISKEAAGLIQLQLAMEEYSVPREYLLSIMPQEWTVSERSQWQEVFRVKSKLDLIQEHIREHSVRCGVDPQAPSASPPETFVYSSLNDWRSLAECESQLKMGAWDIELARFCKEVLLPKASQLQVTDRSFSAVIQLLHELAGLETTLIFLAVE